jgi:hypothetical protein
MANERADHRIAFWYHLPSQLITLMACKGRVGIPHCPPPLPLLMSAARPSYDGPRDGAFSCCWCPCIPLIRIPAPGPAWEESMSPADFILLTNWLDSPCSVQPHPLREFGAAWVFRGRRSLLAFKVSGLIPGLDVASVIHTNSIRCQCVMMVLPQQLNNCCLLAAS